MKGILITSTVTFLLIFGGIAALALHLSQQAQAGGVDDPADAAANQRLLTNLAADRDRLQREREQLAGMQQMQAAREALMDRVHDELLEVVQEIETKQEAYIAEQDAAAAKLAKMYEAMKPARAANILAAMEMEVTLSILSRMKERPAAKVLAAMDAGIAAQLSTRLSRQEGT